jgi:hypothetical protein
LLAACAIVLALCRAMMHRAGTHEARAWGNYGIR